MSKSSAQLVTEPGVGLTEPRRLQKRRRSGRAGYVFLIPCFVGLAIFTIGPMIYSLYLSFTNYDLLQSPTWVGLQNYREMFTSDPRYFHSVSVTIKYVFLSVPIMLALALGIAMLLNRKRRGVGVYRSLFYLPSLLGSSVAVALVWRSMFGQNGSLNAALSVVGVHGPDWINSRTWALGRIIVLGCWQFGASMVIWHAGLNQIPVELYEAAGVDGAGRWRKFMHITLPLLAPVI